MSIQLKVLNYSLKKPGYIMNDVNIDELREKIEPVFTDMENDIKETE